MSVQSEALRQIEAWIAQPAFSELVAHFGGKVPTEGSLLQRLTELEEFSSVWDMRGGKHRLDMRQLDLDPATEHDISQLITQLGFRSAGSPSAPAYDWILVLGGLVNSCRSRTKFAAEQVNNGRHTVNKDVVLLGSFRPLHEDEEPVAAELLSDLRCSRSTFRRIIRATGRRLGSISRKTPKSPPKKAHRKRWWARMWPFRSPVLKDEASCLMTAADLYFGEGDWASNLDLDKGGDPHKSQAVHRKQAATSAVTLLASRSSDPGKRYANTGDTYRFFSDTCKPAPGATALLITSAIYRQYQHFDAIRMLGIPAQLQIETVGFTPITEPPHFTTAWYLQEVRSTIRSARALAEAIAADQLSADPPR